MTLNEVDKAGLIRESYRIEGITTPECRSIFLDWALQLPAGVEPREAIALVLEAYGADEAHPMTAVLREGLTPAVTPRRGGAKGRRLRAH